MCSPDQGSLITVLVLQEEGDVCLTPRCYRDTVILLQWKWEVSGIENTDGVCVCVCVYVYAWHVSVHVYAWHCREPLSHCIDCR